MIWLHMVHLLLQSYHTLKKRDRGSAGISKKIRMVPDANLTTRFASGTMTTFNWQSNLVLRLNSVVHPRLAHSGRRRAIPRQLAALNTCVMLGYSWKRLHPYSPANQSPCKC